MFEKKKKQLKYKNNDINNRINKNFCEINFRGMSVQQSFNGYIYLQMKKLSRDKFS